MRFNRNPNPYLIAHNVCYERYSVGVRTGVLQACIGGGMPRVEHRYSKGVAVLQGATGVAIGSERDLWQVLTARYLASLTPATRTAYANDLLGPRAGVVLAAIAHDRGEPGTYTVSLAPNTASDVSLTGYALTRGLNPLYLDRTALDLWRETLAANYAPSTVARRLAAAAGVYGYAVDEGYLSASPATRIRRPKVSSESPREGVTREEAAALLGVADRDPKDAALIGFLLLLGLRASEVGRISATDISQDRGHVTVVVNGKGGRRDRLPMPPYLLNALERLGPAVTPSTPLISAARSGPLDRHAVRRTVERLARHAGITRRLCPHDLRHGFVTTALAAGVPLHSVQDAARHADPATTRRYDRARYALDGHAAYGVANYLLAAAQ